MTKTSNYLLLLAIIALISGCNSLPENLKKLKSKYALDRCEAIHWLYHHVKSDTTRNLLTEALHKDESDVVRSLAARLMALGGDKSYIPDLQKALEDSSPLVRMEVAQSLGSLQSRQSLGKLGSLLAKGKNEDRIREQDAWVRLKIIKSMEYMEAKQAVPVLIEALADNEPAVKFQALLLLEKFTGKKLGTDKESWNRWYQQQSQKKTS